MQYWATSSSSSFMLVHKLSAKRVRASCRSCAVVTALSARTLNVARPPWNCAAATECARENAALRNWRVMTPVPPVCSQATMRDARLTEGKASWFIDHCQRVARTTMGLRMRLAFVEQTSARSFGQYVTVDGTRLHYIDHGTGRPVVLLHGNGSMV